MVDSFFHRRGKMTKLYVKVMTLVGLLLVAGCATPEQLRNDKGVKHFQLESHIGLEKLYANLLLNFEEDWQTQAIIPFANTLSVKGILLPNEDRGMIYLKRTQWGGTEIVVDLKRLENNHTLVDVACVWFEEPTVRRVLQESSK